MSTFFKPMGYLAAFAAVAGVAGCGSGVNGETPSVAAAAQDERPVPLPQPPLKIPMPLNKAGYKVDVTFEVPPLPEGKAFLGHLIGLRVLFAPGTSNVREALQEHPVTVRISLSRIDGGEEVKIPLFNSVKTSARGESPRRYDVIEIPEGKATASFYYTQHSGAPSGTEDASAVVLSLAGAKRAVTPGVYRFQVETLDDIPELSGVTSFFVYEEHPEG